MHTLAVFILASSYSTHTYTFFITDSDIYYSRKTDSCPTEVRLNSGSKVDAVAELDRRDRQMSSVPFEKENRLMCEQCFMESRTEQCNRIRTDRPCGWFHIWCTPTGMKVNNSDMSWNESRRRFGRRPTQQANARARRSPMPSCAMLISVSEMSRSE